MQSELNIGVDIGRAYREGRGISIYIKTLLTEFGNIAPDEYKFKLLHFDEHPPQDTFGIRNAEAIELPFPSRADTWDRLLHEQKIYPEFQRDIGLDVMWHPQNHGQYWTPVGYVCTMHDVLPLDRPDLCTNLSGVPAEKALSDSRIYSAVGADRIIVPTEYSKRTLLRYVSQIDPDNIHVINTGINHDVFNTQRRQEELDQVRYQYGLPQRFVLTVGSYAPHKNLHTLVDAYSQSGITKMGYGLVMVGPMDGSVYTTNADDIRRQVRQLGLEDHVVMLPTTPLHDLVSIYNSASIFCITSEYEGFGAPPTEAMACGVPVISSNATSLPEVCGQAALLADPFDTRTFANHMELLATDQDEYRRYKEAGLLRAQDYNWTKSAQRVLDVLVSAARR